MLCLKQMLAGLMIIKIALGKQLVQVNLNPLKNANPVIGQLDKLETIKEYKVEMICTNNNLNSAINAMKSAHPYEQVAYAVIKMENQ